MTICIGAICDHLTGEGRTPRIVLCSDMRGSSALGSKEYFLKERPLRGTDWTCLMAGVEHEILATVPILQRQFKAAEKIDETNVCTIARAALSERKAEKADTFTRGKWGLSYEQFRKERANFPEDTYRDSMEHIGRMVLDADFIISGFLEDDGFPVLLETDATGDVKLREDFALVGEGTWLAQASLTSREQVMTDPLSRALFCVYEAKKQAQRIGSVGTNTLLSVHTRGEGSKLVRTKVQEYLDEQVALYGPKPPPKFPQDFDFFAA